MSNELIFFLIIMTSLFSVLFSAYLGKTWLMYTAGVLALISSVTAGKIISIFGFETSIATPIYAGIFLSTDVLSEWYSKSDAKKTIYLGFFANILLVILGLLISFALPSSSQELSNALDIIFGFIPRLVLAGLTAFIIAQTIDIKIYHYLKDKNLGGQKYGLLVRNNISTTVSQLVDSIIVYTLAFYGNIPFKIIISLIVSAWVFKIIVAILDTPFIYLINYLKQH